MSKKKQTKHRTPRQAMRFSVRLQNSIDGGWKMVARFVHQSDADAFMRHATKRQAFAGVTLALFHQNNRMEVIQPDGVCTRTAIPAEVQQPAPAPTPCSEGTCSEVSHQ